LIVAGAGTAVVPINLAGGWYERRYLRTDRPEG